MIYQSGLIFFILKHANMKSEKIIVVGLTLLVSGFVLGTLLAPEKGSVIRQRTADRMGGYARWLVKLSDDMLTEVVQAIDTIKERRTDISRHP